jgi:glycosyltransferase involved in cell wall biosynthesis
MSRVTRLLLIAQPLAGGVPRHVLDIVEELHAEEFEVTVACPTRSFLWEQLSGRDQVRLHPFTRHREPHLSDVAWMLKLVPLVRRNDVVHAHSSKASWLARAAALLAGRRSSCVVTPHAWSFWALSGWRRRAVEALERVAAHACVAIVAVASHEQTEGLRLHIGHAERYRLIPNGIDLQRWVSDRRPDPNVVLMVGRLVPQKRPELAVHALALAKRQRPAMRLVITGGGPMEHTLRALSAALGVDDAVLLLGPRDDVPDLLSRAGCLLVTSAYEGCSLVILEAMAAAVPVVAVRIGGIDEVLQDGVTGLLCDARPEDIAAALVLLVDHPATARRLGDEARRRAWQRYSRRDMALALSALYESLVPADRRRSCSRRLAKATPGSDTTAHRACRSSDEWGMPLSWPQRQRRHRVAVVEALRPEWDCRQS